MSQYTKDPEAVLDYRTDWSAWLADSETITDAAVTVSDGITVDSQTHDGTSVTVWLSGGATDQRYEVTYHVTTDQGRQDERTDLIAVRDR